MITANVTGIPAIKDELSGIVDEKKWDKVFADAMEQATAYAKDIAPRDTGMLADSIYWTKTDQYKYEFGCAVYYGIYHEYGTMFLKVGTASKPHVYLNTAGGISYRPFMRTAMWKMMRRFPEYAGRILFP